MKKIPRAYFQNYLLKSQLSISKKMQIVMLLLYQISSLQISCWFPSFFFFFISYLETLSHYIFPLACLDFSFSYILNLFFYSPHLDTTSAYVFPHFIQDGLKISQCLYNQVLLDQIFLVFIHRIFSSWICSDKMVFKLYISQSSVEFFS